MSEKKIPNSEIYANQELQKLKALYQSALDYRLNLKKKMKNIIIK